MLVRNLWHGPLKGEILAKKQFCFKSKICICVKLFQRFEVDNCLPVLMLGIYFQLF